VETMEYLGCLCCWPVTSHPGHYSLQKLSAAMQVFPWDSSRDGTTSQVTWSPIKL
jgi:hypothetical protein